jgi:hypothetical protein
MLSYFKNLLPEIFDESKRMAVEVVMKTFDEAALQAQGTIAKGNEMLILAHRECFQSIRNILIEQQGHSATLDRNQRNSNLSLRQHRTLHHISI